MNQYDFLRAVGKVGINYKNLGYDHFYEFLTDSGLFSFWTDFSGEKPIRYVIEKAKPKSHEEQRRPQYNRAATQYVDSEEVVKSNADCVLRTISLLVSLRLKEMKVGLR